MSFLYDGCKGAHHHDGIKIMERFIKLERFNEMTQCIEIQKCDVTRSFGITSND